MTCVSLLMFRLKPHQDVVFSPESKGGEGAERSKGEELGQISKVLPSLLIFDDIEPRLGRRSGRVKAKIQVRYLNFFLSLMGLESNDLNSDMLDLKNLSRIPPISLLGHLVSNLS